MFVSRRGTAVRILQRAYARLCRLLLGLAVGLTAFAVMAVALRSMFLTLLVAAAVCWRRLGRWRGSTSHGSARFASLADVSRMLDNNDGLILGRVGSAGRPSKAEAIRALFSPFIPSVRACGMFASAFYKSRWMENRILRVRDFCHLATISRTGGGKGVSVVIPNLLSYCGSAVVIDPKCENYHKTAAFRRDRMGHKIVRLDPMLLGGPGASAFNPLAFIDASAPDFLDQCRDLANMLVVRQGTEPEPFWNDSAELVLTAFIAFVCACEPNPKERNLDTVRLLVSDRDKFTRAVEVMRQMDNSVVQRLGGQLTWFVDRELGSVLTTVQRHTAWADSQAVAACLNSNGFDPRELRGGRVTVYLVLPPERLVTLAPLMRMWVGSILRIITRQGADERHPILFMLDEVAQLGRLQALEDAVCIMRGYGIRLWFILQSIEQLKTCYGEKAGVVLDNISTLQVFNINSLETAETLSKRAGDETIRVHTPNSNYASGTGTSIGSSPGQSTNSSSSHGMNTAELARKLLLPDEILRLPEDVALIWHKNLPVIAAWCLRYYNAPEFARGRMGMQRGLGLAAIIRAAAAVAVSIVFAVLVAAMPTARFQTASPQWHLPPQGQEQWARPLPSASGGGFSSTPAFPPAGRAGGPVDQWNPNIERSILWPVNRRNRNR